MSIEQSGEVIEEHLAGEITLTTDQSTTTDTSEPEFFIPINTPKQSVLPKEYQLHSKITRQIKRDIQKHKIQTVIGSTEIPPQPNRSVAHKQESNVRVFFQNVNGIAPYDSSWITSLEVLKDLQVDIIQLAETNIDWNQLQHRQKFKKTIQSRIGQASVLQAAIHDKSKLNYLANQAYKPGGVAQIIRSPWTIKIQDTGQDPLGRWVWHTVTSKNNTSITIITAYKVSNIPLHRAGVQTVISQLYRAHQRRGMAVPNPWKQWTIDFMVMLQQQLQHGREIILSIDVNEPIEDKPAQGSLLQALQETPLVDIMQIRTEANQKLPSLSHGSMRIDGIFCTPMILHHIVHIEHAHFTKGIPASDHRPIILDISSEIMDGIPPAIETPKRIITTGNKNKVEAYVEAVHAHVSHHKLRHKISLLQKVGTHNRKQAIRLSEQIDDIKREAMKHGEKSCGRNTRHHNFDWSPELGLAGWQVLYWKTITRQRSTLSSATLSFLQRKAKLTYWELEQHPPEAYRQAKQKYWKLYKSQEKLRHFFLQEQANSWLKQYNDLKETDPSGSKRAYQLAITFREMKKKEQQTKRYSHIRVALGRAKSGGMRFLLIPTETEDVYTRLEGESNLTTALLKRNKQHLNQAGETPFGTKQGRDKTDPLNAHNDIENILQGSPKEWANLDKVSGRWMRNLKTHLTVEEESQAEDAIGQIITITDFRSFFKKVPERTASSPSGLHLGHYKAIASDDTLAALWADSLGLQVQLQLPPKRWLTSLHCMIEKDKGSPKINRLRIVQLLEADLNFVFKLIWGYRFSRFCESMNSLMDFQDGSRPARQSINTVLKKILTYDCLYTKREHGATLDNDAVGCYDRVLPGLTILTCRRLGLPSRHANLMHAILTNMEHKVRTTYGMSSDSITWTDTYPLFGTGQGSGASPVMWVTTCEVNMRVLTEMGHPVILVSPNGAITTNRLADAFVDDTTLHMRYTSSNGKSAAKAVTRRLQHNGQIYEKALHTSGGALALHKCLWYLLIGTWVGTQYKWTTKAAHDNDIRLRDSDTGRTETIKRFNPSESHRTLGVYVAPDGNQREQTKQLQTKSNNWAKGIKYSTLTKRETEMAFKTVMVAQWRYALAATQMTKQQCNTAEGRALHSLMHKLGTTSKYPTALTSGSHQHGGLGLPSIYHLQITQRVVYLIGNIRTNNSTGKLLQIAIHNAQLELGIDQFILQADFTRYGGWISPTWITSLWKDCSQVGLKVHMHSHWKLSQRYQGDEAIMDMFIQQGIYTKADMQILNAVRLYKRIYRKSDIVHAITGQLRSSAKDMTQHDVWNIAWPNQRKPHKDWMPLWCRALTRITKHVSFPITPSWTTNEWKWWYVEATNSLYSSKNDHWTIYTANPLTNHYSHQGTQASQPQHPQRVYMHQTSAHGRTIACIIPGEGLITKTQTPPHTIEEAMRSLSPEYRHILGTIEGLEHSQYIASLLEQGNALGASDGSVIASSATHGWVLSGYKHLQKQIRGSGAVAGADLQKHSYRAECWARLSILIVLEVITTFYNISSESTINITIVIDNKSVLQIEPNSNTIFSVASATRTEADLISEIEAIQQRLPLRIAYRWERSHPKKITTIWQKLNETADNLASEAHIDSHISIRTPPLPASKISCSINNVPITGRMNVHIMHQLQIYESTNYILQKHNWILSEMNLIDWPAIRDTITNQTLQMQLALSKLQHDWQPTNEYRAKREPHRSQACELCESTLEDSNHKWSCTHSDMNNHRQSEWIKFQETLRTTNTPPDISQAILAGVQHWTKTGTNLKAVSQYPKPTRILITSQSRIGWEHFVRGRISTAWRRWHRILSTSRNHQTTKQWTSSLVRNILRYGLELWWQRNTLVHGTTHITRQHRRRKELLQYVKLTQQNPPALCANDMQILSPPRVPRTTSTSGSLLAWLHTVDTAREIHKSLESRERKKQLTLCSWLRTNISST